MNKRKHSTLNAKKFDLKDHIMIDYSTPPSGKIQSKIQSPAKFRTMKAPASPRLDPDKSYSKLELENISLKRKLQQVLPSFYNVQVALNDKKHQYDLLFEANNVLKNEHEKLKASLVPLESKQKLSDKDCTLCGKSSKSLFFSFFNSDNRIVKCQMCNALICGDCAKLKVTICNGCFSRTSLLASEPSEPSRKTDEELNASAARALNIPLPEDTLEWTVPNNLGTNCSAFDTCPDCGHCRGDVSHFNCDWSEYNKSDWPDSSSEKCAKKKCLDDNFLNILG